MENKENLTKKQLKVMIIIYFCLFTVGLTLLIIGLKTGNPFIMIFGAVLPGIIALIKVLGNIWSTYNTLSNKFLITLFTVFIYALIGLPLCLIKGISSAISYKKLKE